MPETLKLKEEDLKGHILKTVQPMVEEMCGKLVGERIEESISKAFEVKLKEAESGYPAWLNKEPTEKAPEPQVREKGHAMARWARAIAATKNDVGKAIHVLKGWGDDDLAKSATEFFEKDAMMASNPELGGYLVPPDVSSDYVELLKPASVMRRLGAVVIPMPAGNYEIPKVTQGSNSFYQGESQNIPPSLVKTGMLRLVFKKLTSLVPVSNDLLRFSSPGADTLVRDDMVRGGSARENQAFIRDNGVDSTPKGLLHWAAAPNKITANATVSLANTTLDLGRMVLGLMNNNIPMTRPAWIMNPKVWNYLTTLTNGNGVFIYRDEMVGNATLWGWPYAVTTSIPSNLGTGSNKSECYLADMADMIIGESLTPRIDSSSTAAYHDGTSVVAAFSKDETVIRVITEHDFLARRAESISVLESVGWGN